MDLANTVRRDRSIPAPGARFAAGSHDLILVLLFGLWFVAIFLARFLPTTFWMIALCLSGPSLYFTVQSTIERFARAQAEAGRFNLVLSLGLLFSPLVGAALGKLSLRDTSKT